MGFPLSMKHVLYSVRNRAAFFFFFEGVEGKVIALDTRVHVGSLFVYILMCVLAKFPLPIITY